LINIIIDENIDDEKYDRFINIVKYAIPNLSNNIKEGDLLYFDSASIADIDLMYLSRKSIPKNITVNSLEDLTGISKNSSSIATIDVVTKEDDFNFDNASISDFLLQNKVEDTDDNKILFLKFELYLFCKKLGKFNIHPHHLILNSRMLEFRNILSSKISAYNFKLYTYIAEYDGKFKEYYDVSFYIPHRGSSRVSFQFESTDFLNDRYFKKKLNEKFTNIFSVEWDIDNILFEQYMENLSLLNY